MTKAKENAVAVTAQPFSALRDSVARQFVHMAQHQLFRTDASKDALWEAYLAAFRPEDNPLHKTRTEHDCQCCRHFIRSMGGVVAVVDDSVISLWDADVPERYTSSVEAMAALVAAASVVEPFLSPERQVGTAKNFQQLAEGVVTWDHFHLTLPPAVFCKKDDIGPRTSEARGTKDSMLRSLQEITLESVDQVLELVAQNSLYRGAEHRFAVEAFRKLKTEWDMMTDDTVRDYHDGDANPEFDAALTRKRDLFCWSRVATVPASVAKMRSTVIGTLLTDLSEGKDVDVAVTAFEAKVAPMNYKRPTALVTKAMIEKVRATVEELGYAAALERRFAVLEDVAVGNVIFADRSARKVMGTVDVFDGLIAKVAERPSKLDKVEEVPVERFLAEVLPRAATLEVMLENRHAGSLVSLMAPVDPGAKALFKWDNAFSWSYAGELADSIKERVKRAGGSVTGDLRCSLSWFNYDDLDLHLLEPGGASTVAMTPTQVLYGSTTSTRSSRATEIYYGNKNSPSGGVLDVDMNAGFGKTRSAVESITYPRRDIMLEGEYRLWVNNFNRRETTDVGFDAELEFDGVVHQFHHEKAVPNRGIVVVAVFNYTHKNGVVITKSLPSSQSVKKLWGPGHAGLAARQRADAEPELLGQRY